MYTYVRALARIKGGNGTWADVDISTMPLSQVYTTYSSIKAILTNPVISGQMTVDFDDLPDTLRILTITFPQWLVSIGNATLPVTYSVPSTDAATVRAIDAWYWNFDIKPANHTKHPDAEMAHDDQVDLFITKTGVDPLEVQKYCISTVNGMTHPLTSSTQGTFVLGGCTSGRLAKNNQVGLIDFAGLGSIETVNLASSMIVNRLENVPLTESVFVNVGQSMLGKTVFLSFAGYLFVLDNAYDVVADQVLKINTRVMNLLSRYYEGRNYVDWSSVFVPFEASRLPDRIEEAAFFTDTLIENILNMPQTFVIILDAVDVQVSYQSVGTSQLPGVYVSQNSEPVAPLKVNLGRLPEYMAVQEIDDWAIKVDGYMTESPQRELVSFDDLVIYENGSRSPRPERYANAQLMLIQKMQLVSS